MFNFYKRFLPNAAKTLAPLNDLLQGNIRGKIPMAWFSIVQEAFDAIKFRADKTALLAHPKTNAGITLFTDASNQNIGAALQQQRDNVWEP